MLTICASGGAVIGGIVGFALPPRSDRELVENVVSGAQIGAVFASGLGFVVWIVGSVSSA